MAKKVRITRQPYGDTNKQRGKIRHFRLGEGLPKPQEIRNELEEMRRVLLGHEDPPINLGLMTLMEVAEGYYSRACDIEQQIIRAEQEGRIPKNSGYHTLRTQEIRSFKDMSKSAAELGSRRVTYVQNLVQREKTGRESS